MSTDSEHTVGAQSVIASLTDGTSEVADDSIDAIPAISAVGGGVATVSAVSDVPNKAAVEAAFATVQKDIADLTAKVNAILAAMRAANLIQT